MWVLIAEDERRLADAIARGLRREGMAVDLFPSNIRSGPKSQAASTACQSLLVRPRPVGARTTTTAKS